jgi:hypothetical protein
MNYAVLAAGYQNQNTKKILRIRLQEIGPKDKIKTIKRKKIDLNVVPIEKLEEINLILGQAHFIKTVENLHDALVTVVPGIQFGLAFCESS